MTEVKFYEDARDELLKFAIILAKYHGKYIFCKHKERDTWETPGGHREPMEKIEDTASRELYEETGAVEFTMVPICICSVTGKDSFDEEETFGKLFYAEVEVFETELHSEIEKIAIMDTYPEQWTYPFVTPLLMEEAEKRGFVF